MKQALSLFLVLFSLGFPALAQEQSAPGPAPELPIIKAAEWGPCMDATVVGERLYAIGRGKLHVADLTHPRNPRKLGELSGLGNTRQIEVSEGIAYVTSREDGVFIIDVGDSAQPELLCHYDSIELATGVAIAGDVLFVAQRQYGVEQIDVSDPRKPKHISTVRTGEAQSIFYQDGYLYCGIWGRSEVVVVDMRDARSPTIVSRVPLDGYGDGLCVRDGLLYATTGHHSREPHRQEGDPGYGNGHGLEIFDLTDPAKPTFISRVKFPKFYHIGFDMWDVSVVNGHAFVADTHNGIFVLDVNDPRNPVITCRTTLPVPEGRDVPALFGGLALGEGVIYGAGGWTDLHIIDAADTAQPVIYETGTSPEIGPQARAKNDRVIATYRPGGQVWGVAAADDLPLAVAVCGSAGIHVVRASETSLEPMSIVPTSDFATGVCLHQRRVFVAEGTGGLSIWELSEEGELQPLGRYDARGKRVRYVSVPSPGNYALLEVGAGRLQIVDVSDPVSPQLALEDTQPGLLYGYQMVDQLVDGRYAGVFWHVSGLHWYDLSTDPPQYQGNHPAGRFNMSDGITLYRDRLLATRARGYVLFDFEGSHDFAELPIRRIEGVNLLGKPTLDGDHLYLTDRVNGNITIVDLENPDQPQVIDSYVTAGNPDRVTMTPNGYLLPNGYDGLHLCRRPN